MSSHIVFDSSDDEGGPDVFNNKKSSVRSSNQESDSTDDSENDESSSGEGDSENEGGSESEDEEISSDKDHSQMTMEELLKLQEEIGTKAFKEKVLNPIKKKNNNEVKSFKRANKNRPREVPMMRRAAPRMSFLEPEKKIGKKISRDPRFDDLSGTLHLKSWQKKYGFIVEKRKEEKELLKKELMKERDPEKKEKLKSIIQRMENQERERAKREREESVLNIERDQQIENLNEGKKPRFITKSEKKLLLKAAHFEQLKKENRVDKYMEKKEKGKTAKERRGN